MKNLIRQKKKNKRKRSDSVQKWIFIKYIIVWWNTVTETKFEKESRKLNCKKIFRKYNH